MDNNDQQIETILNTAAIDANPDPGRIHTVHTKMKQLADSAPQRRRRRQMRMTALSLILAMSVMGLTTSRAALNFVLSLLVPIYSSETIVWSPPGSRTTYSRGTWTSTNGNVDPNSAQTRVTPSPEDIRAAQDEFKQIHQLAEAGQGRLTGLLEGPGFNGSPIHITHQVEYTLSDGRTVSSGGELTPAQAANMKLDELMKLRDAGAGEIISQEDGSLGLGMYILRFTRSDGTAIDLLTNYPPGPREGRLAIFAETRELKQQRQFTVRDPRRLSAGPRTPTSVWGLLRYTLRDGRTVGISEEVPPEVISPDGESVINPEPGSSPRIETDPSCQTDTTPKKVLPPVPTPAPPTTPAEHEQMRQLAKEGQGQLISLYEVPGDDKTPIRTTYMVQYTLSDGRTRVSGNLLTPAQITNMKIDELLQLRDAGAGEIVTHQDYPFGLGLYTLRFTRSDGTTIDLQTWYPPGPRENRLAIFAETRALKKRLQFAVINPLRSLRDEGRSSVVWAILRYKLSDGRMVGITEEVPSQAISPDGEYVINAETGEQTRIHGPAAPKK